MSVGSVKNASLFQKLTLNLIGFRVCDVSVPIWCHSSFPACLVETMFTKGASMDKIELINMSVIFVFC